MKQQDRLFLFALTLFVLFLIVQAVYIFVSLKAGNDLSFFDKNPIWIYCLGFLVLWLIPDRK